MIASNVSRYARQMILPQIGANGQARLAAAKLLCVGAGGLGSAALFYLSGAGIGKITIIDDDLVDITNLHRQIIFTADMTGKSKSQMAAQQISAFNPETNIGFIHDRLSADNAEQLFVEHDIIFDGSDNLPTKYLINDMAVRCRKAWVYGAVVGTSGQAAFFDSAIGSCYRCLYPFPPQSPITNCSEYGVIGPIAGMVSMAQSVQVIEYLVSTPPQAALFNKLWTLDGLNMQTRLFDIAKDGKCPVCSDSNLNNGVNFMSNAPSQCSAIRELTPDQARAKPNAVWIDVREIDEWNAGHVQSAMHWALSKLQAGQLPDIAHDKEIVLYCQRGRRSLAAADIMQKNGFKNLYSLTGGYSALR